MHIVGIDIGGTYIKAGLVINPPEVQTFRSVNTKTNILVEQLAKIVLELKGEAVGIGIAGLVTDGIVYSSPNLPSIKELKLQKILQGKLKISVSVANDADMVALGEWKYGAGKETHNLLILTLGTGVGGGIIINDKLYTGKGFAGEVGHLTVDPNGSLCGCGNHGCLETFVGSEYLSEKAHQGIKRNIKTTLSKYSKITPETISKEAYKGDTFAKSIIESAGHYLGIGIASLCAVLDPEKVILGGGISKVGEMLFKEIKKEVNKRLYSRKNIEILPAALGDHAGIVGSAFFVSSLM